jgi:hypothetical protein
VLKALKVEQAAIEKVKAYWRNPRKRGAESVRKIADSISAFGWQQPIVVDRELVVIIGHGRLEAAKLLEQKTVPVVIARNLKPGQVKALRLADNRLNRESDWDAGLLLAEIEELRGLEISVAVAGFSEDDLKRLADDIDEKALEQIADSAGGEETFTAAQDAEYSTSGNRAGNGAVSGDGSDVLVTLSEVLTMRQRKVVNAAINLAKQRERLERRGDALFHVCELYLEENENA